MDVEFAPAKSKITLAFHNWRKTFNHHPEQFTRGEEMKIHTSAKKTYREYCGAWREALQTTDTMTRAQLFEDIVASAAGVCPEICDAAYTAALYERPFSGWRSRVRCAMFYQRKMILVAKSMGVRVA